MEIFLLETNAESHHIDLSGYLKYISNEIYRFKKKKTCKHLGNVFALSAANTVTIPFPSQRSVLVVR